MKNRIAVFTILLFFTAGKLQAQVLETEESKPLLPGQAEVGAGYEYQVSKEGHESALPLSFEYGLAKKLTFLFEPVPTTIIQPKIGRRAAGLGDIELTFFYQIIKETKTRPAISLSAEVKFPVAKDSLIGTGKTDFTPFIIASKNTGRFFTSINFSYTFLGKPADIVVNNLFNYAAGTIFSVNEKNIFFGELYGNTSAFGGKDVVETVNPIPGKSTEISGGEVVGAIGYGHYIKTELLLSFGVSYDNNNAFLFRPGIEWRFGGGKPTK